MDDERRSPDERNARHEAMAASPPEVFAIPFGHGPGLVGVISADRLVFDVRDANMAPILTLFLNPDGSGFGVRVNPDIEVQDD